MIRVARSQSMLDDININYVMFQQVLEPQGSGYTWNSSFRSTTSTMFSNQSRCELRRVALDRPVGSGPCFASEDGGKS
jgi:hypothetical protein